MHPKKTVVVAMSGGVDSAVAAALLKRDGWDVVGITLQIWQERADDDKHGGCCSLGAVEDARRAANLIGIPHYVLNFRDYFAAKVVDYFVDEYRRGRTPNPCVECNRSVKFDEMLSQALNLGAHYLATGHYARIRRNPECGRYDLLKAFCSEKDQSYALYTLTQEQLEHTMFPLGDLDSKAETRRIATEMGLKLANKADSQEICFVPRSGYTGFLSGKAPETMRPGPIVNTRGKQIGTHDGIAFYTIGQRKRLPASDSGALYVVSIDPDTDTVVVGSNDELYGTAFVADRLNWISDETPELPLAVSARIRYNGTASQGALQAWETDDSVLFRFEHPVRAITPGQSAVFYDGERVVGGGTIRKEIASN